MKNFIIIAAISIIVIPVIFRFRCFIVGFIWDMYLKCVSDEHLERIIRKQYETFEKNPVSFSYPEILWLKDMAEYLCKVWAGKVYADCLSDSTESNNVSESQQMFHTLYFWQSAYKKLISEVYRREYFTS